MCEPLRHKGVKKKCYDPSGKYTDHTLYFEEDIKSAIEFYKKYRDNPVLFYNEHHEIKENTKRIDFFGVENIGIDSYNTWLFDYCFGDVIE